MARAPIVYSIACPPGMLAFGQVKRFTSVSAFDGYVGALRAAGYAVTFTAPTAFVCGQSPLL